MNRDQFFFAWKELEHRVRLKLLALNEDYRHKRGRKPAVLSTLIDLADADRCRKMPAIRLVEIEQIVDSFWA